MGGVVQKQHGSLLSWAMYLNDYGRYMPPVSDGPAEYLTDCNVSYKRTVLEPLRDLWNEEFHETTVNWRLLEQGESLWLSSGVEVLHDRELGLGEGLWDRFAFGRLFASTRVAQVTTFRRWLFAAASWLLPPILVWRAAKTVMRKRKHRLRFVQSLPLLVLTTYVWATGEFVGYVTGRAGQALSPEKATEKVAAGAEAAL